jgi:hypothetical protein
VHVISRDVFARHENGRPPAAGFLSYIDPVRPHLMLCLGREDYSDGYDDYAAMRSFDNGATWTEPELFAKSFAVPGGRMRYAEPAAFYDTDTRRLVVVTYRMLYPDDALDTDAVTELVYDELDPAANRWAERRVLSEIEGGRLAVSFGFPIKTSSGKVLVPAMRTVRDSDGKAIHYRGCWSPLYECVTLIGEYGDDGALRWSHGEAVRIDAERTSRGLSENALAELADGRIAMVARGDNSMFPEQPGCKWWCTSRDDGRTWSVPEPLACMDGTPIESSSTGCALIRSIVNGKLYFLGNLCPQGVRANGNWPRSPLVIAEMRENPLAIERETITVVGDREAGECDQVQHSNFRWYQDRATGDVVIFLTRYGERGAKDWLLSDCYRYRVAMD